MYIGNSPAGVGNYQVVDDISSTFNGTLKTFALTASSLAINPAKSGQLLVSINGVLQEPDDTGTEGFKVSGSNIVFSSAPATGSTFWAVWQGQAVDIGTPSDGVVGTAQMSYPLANFTSTGIDDNATSTAITIDANDNVGIGVTPEAHYTIYDCLDIGLSGGLYSNKSGTNLTALTNNAYINASGADWIYKETDEANLFRQTNGQFQFYVAPSGTAGTAITYTTAMTIENSAYINFGTFSSSGASIGKEFGGGVQAYVTKTSANSTNNRDHYLFYNPNGNVGKISTSASATSYATSSDYRLKENVVPMSGSIDRLKALKPSNFNFIVDPLNTVDGFLAHEAQSIVPECVSGEKDAMMDEEYEVTPAVMDGETVVTEAVMGTRSVPDYQGIDQSKLVPLLVASLQEAVAKIEALEARVTALEV